MADWTEGALKNIKDQCSSEVAFSIDLENYDEAKWVKAHLYDGYEGPDGSARKAREDAASSCKEAVDAVYYYCKPKGEPQGKAAGKHPQKDRDRSDTTPSPPKPAVKMVACRFAGGQAKEEHEKEDDWIRRNVSFADGTLTMHPLPKMGDVRTNATHALYGRDAPENAPRANGKTCSSHGQCRSNLCSASACRGCMSDASCGSGRVCQKGVCWVPQTEEKKTRGDLCFATSECEPGLLCIRQSPKLAQMCQ